VRGLRLAEARCHKGVQQIVRRLLGTRTNLVTALPLSKSESRTILWHVRR